MSFGPFQLLWAHGNSHSPSCSAMVSLQPLWGLLLPEFCFPKERKTCVFNKCLPNSLFTKRNCLPRHFPKIPTLNGLILWLISLLMFVMNVKISKPYNIHEHKGLKDWSILSRRCFVEFWLPREGTKLFQLKTAKTMHLRYLFITLGTSYAWMKIFYVKLH